jgi:excisionase family DNA binding protein
VPKQRRRSKPTPAAADASLLTVAETAAHLHVHQNTVRRLLARGELTPVRVGRAVRIQRAELEAYVRGGGDVAAGPKPITPEMLRALHAKANQIDRAHDRELGTTKRAILQAAGERFGRTLTSSTELSAVEGDWVLDRLSEAQAELPR